MAREDILAALQIALTQKEGPPAPSANTLIQKMIAPNDKSTFLDTGVTFTIQNPDNYVWGGNVDSSATVFGVDVATYISPGWKWNQGQYK